MAASSTRTARPTADCSRGLKPFPPFRVLTPSRVPIITYNARLESPIVNNSKRLIVAAIALVSMQPLSSFGAEILSQDRSLQAIVDAADQNPTAGDEVSDFKHAPGFGAFDASEIGRNLNYFISVINDEGSFSP